jgi:hypothetical protein
MEYLGVSSLPEVRTEIGSTTSLVITIALAYLGTLVASVGLHGKLCDFQEQFLLQTLWNLFPAGLRHYFLGGPPVRASHSLKMCVTSLTLQRTSLWVPRGTGRKNQGRERAKSGRWRGSIWRA